jgi:hypothetical protein
MKIYLSYLGGGFSVNIVVVSSKFGLSSVGVNVSTLILKDQKYNEVNTIFVQ